MAFDSIVFPSRASIGPELASTDPNLVADVFNVDFRHVPAIGSMDLSALIQFSLRMRHLRKRVVIFNANPCVKEVLRVTRFAKLAGIVGQAELCD